MRPITMHLGVSFALMLGGTVLVRADGPVPGAPPTATPSAAPTATAPTATPAAAPSGSKIQFETPTYDFGKAKAGDPIKHTFVFTNTGCETLEISNVRPGCGC